MKAQTVVLLAIIVIIGALLRLWQISESFWIDELHTSWVVTGPITDVADRAALGNQSPLYFWLAWLCARLSLGPEIAIRLPSLLAGCALPAAVFWLAQELLRGKEKTEDNTAPLLAAALVAIDPLAIFYSQEARPYALLLLTVVVHFALLLRILERTTWPARVGWVLTGALIVHWHYTGALILVAECVSLVVLMIFSPKSTNEQTCGDKNDVAMCGSCWVDLGVLALLLLPAIPGILAVAARRENWEQFVKPQAAVEILRMFPWTPAIIVLGLLNSKRPVVSPRNLVLLAGWLLVPLCLAWICTRTDLAALFHKRYLIAAWPASILAAALCVRLGLNRATQAAIAAVVLAISFANSGLVQNWRQDGRLLHDRREDWRAAMGELSSLLAREQDRNSALVLLNSGLIEADELPQSQDPRLIEYCLYPLSGAYSIPDGAQAYPVTKTNSGKYLLPAAYAQLQAPTTRSVWVIGRGSPIAREETLRGLDKWMDPGTTWAPQPPQTFGTVYLQQVIVRER